MSHTTEKKTRAVVFLSSLGCYQSSASPYIHYMMHNNDSVRRKGGAPPALSDNLSVRGRMLWRGFRTELLPARHSGRMKIMIYSRTRGHERSPESNTRCRAGNCARQIIFFVYLCWAKTFLKHAKDDPCSAYMEKKRRRLERERCCRPLCNIQLTSWPCLYAVDIGWRVLYRYSNFISLCAPAVLCLAYSIGDGMLN